MNRSNHQQHTPNSFVPHQRDCVCNILSILCYIWMDNKMRASEICVLRGTHARRQYRCAAGWFFVEHIEKAFWWDFYSDFVLAKMFLRHELRLRSHFSVHTMHSCIQILLVAIFSPLRNCRRLMLAFFLDSKLFNIVFFWVLSRGSQANQTLAITPKNFYFIYNEFENCKWKVDCLRNVGGAWMMQKIFFLPDSLRPLTQRMIYNVRIYNVWVPNSTNFIIFWIIH